MRRAVIVLAVAVLATTACGSGSREVFVTGTSSTIAPASSPSASTPARSPAGPLQTERLDVHYVQDALPAHTLDLFLPDGGAKAPYPLLIVIHGGGWRLGDKSDLSRGADVQLDKYKALLLDSGYAVASINYRLSGEATFPANIHDAKAAVRYLRANAVDLGVDPNRFAVIGDSAGGHLALLLGMSSGDAALEGTLGTTGVSSAVQTVVSYYGFSDLRVRTQQLIDQGCGGREGGRDFTSEGIMLGAEPDTDKGRPLAAQASPITYVDAADPPTLLFHGTADCTSPTAQSKTMEAALTAAGVPTELRLIDAGHAQAEFFVNPDLQQQLLRFLGAHLTAR
jgi:acetyl esterase/lipase